MERGLTFAWLKSAYDRACGSGVNISVEDGGIAIWAVGEWTLRTWQELERAKVDPLTPTVDAVKARVARKLERPF